MELDFSTVYSESFETFRVFENLKVADITNTEENCISTIWQTINHLIIWQNYQLKRLRHLKVEKPLHEFESWIIEKYPKSQSELDSAVEEINHQIFLFKKALTLLSTKDVYLMEKLRIFQESALHLSFHIGEIIHIRRISGSYPLPHQMKGFLD